MRAITATEFIMINGGTASTTDYTGSAYKFADLIVNIITPFTNFIPLCGSQITDWLKKPFYTPSGVSGISNGQFFIGKTLEKLLPFLF